MRQVQIIKKNYHIISLKKLKSKEKRVPWDVTSASGYIVQCNILQFTLIFRTYSDYIDLQLFRIIIKR